MAEDTRSQRLNVLERISFHGHSMVLALHPTTIEITTDEHLTRKGDCIVGVGADVGCAGLSDGTKQILRGEGYPVSIRLVVQGEAFALTARGDPRLTLTNPHDIVIRKSEYVSDRTLALGADAAAKDIPRSMVRALKGEKTAGYLEIGVVSVG
jgi:hypothetical protein